MRLGPGPAGPGFHYQRHGQHCRVLHHTPGDPRQGFSLIHRRLEEQFVVHLQQQPRLQSLRLQCRGEPDHGPFDDVRGAALQRRIDGLPFGVGTLGGILVGDSGHPAAAAKGDTT